RGHDERRVEPDGAPKSMGAEETFGRDTRDVELLRATLREQSERVARELRAEHYAGRTVTLKLRFADFSTITRAHTGDPTQDGLLIFRAVDALFSRVRLAQSVRLIGVSLSRLGPPPCRAGARRSPASSPSCLPTPFVASGSHGRWIAWPAASATRRSVRLAS